MPKVNDIYEFLKSIAPEEMALDKDNVGLLAGVGESNVTRLLISLDITNDVISEALDIGAQLIVAHHPLFFSLTRITDADIIGKKIIRLLSGGISAICMHTNLDAAQGGVNDALARAVGIADDIDDAEPLLDFSSLDSGKTPSLGRVGYLKDAVDMNEYLASLKNTLGANGLRYYDAGRPVYKIAISAGSGGDEWDKAIASDCDTFITADIKYHLFLDAEELGINLIDAGHFSTENLVVDVLSEKLSAAFPDIEVKISERHDQIISFC